jgi:hypothetical protein
VLATYLLSEVGRTHLEGTTAVEIGAGAGLVGIVAALLGATVRLTDKAPVLPLLAANAAACPPPRAGAGALLVEPLEWGQRLGGRKRRRRAADAHGGARRPDFVLASDVLGCGDAALYPPLLKTLRELCGPHTAVLMAYKPRARFERAFFAAACEGGGGEARLVARRLGRAALPRDGGGGAGGRTESYRASIDVLELRLEHEARPPGGGSDSDAAAAAPPSEPPPPPPPPPAADRRERAGHVLTGADFDRFYAGMEG